MAPFFMHDNFDTYLRVEKRYSDHTAVAYHHDVEQFFLFYGQAGDELNKINHASIRTWIVDLFEKEVSRKTINRKLSSLRTYFKWLKKEGVVSGNPLAKVTGPKSEKRLPQFAKESELKPEKLEDLFLDDFDGVRDRLIFEMFYQTGIRLSELIELKDENVAVDRIKVFGKRQKERIIPISSELAVLINTYRSGRKQMELDSNYFFLLNNGKKLYPKFVYRKINNYLGCATNLDKTSPHVLRHTFATHLLNNGAGLETLKDLLGHANLSATQVYTHNSFAKLTQIYSQAHPRGRKN
jgi:integrase/recombinase XerC